MHEHFLQSNTWAKFQKALGNTVLKHTTETWSYLAIVEKDRFGTYVYAPYGPYAVDETALGKATKHLLAASKRAGAYVVYIEPFLPVTREMAQTVLPPIGAIAVTNTPGLVGSLLIGSLQQNHYAGRSSDALRAYEREK